MVVILESVMPRASCGPMGCPYLSGSVPVKCAPLGATTLMDMWIFGISSCQVPIRVQGVNSAAERVWTGQQVCPQRCTKKSRTNKYVFAAFLCFFLSFYFPHIQYMIKNASPQLWLTQTHTKKKSKTVNTAVI